MKKKKKVKNARVVCADQKQFWTTQAQFWQWVRELKVVKTDDYPLTGKFVSADEGSMIILNNTVLNSVNRNHISEVLSSRRLMKPRKLK